MCFTIAKAVGCHFLLGRESPVAESEGLYFHSVSGFHLLHVSDPTGCRGLLLCFFGFT